MKDILLIGNANTGKTTLLNALTKSEEHTGNWHGVTVEEKEKKFKLFNKTIKIVDLPGIYSLSPLSLEESVAVKYLFEHKNNLIFNTCDIFNLQKNLYLTVELLEMGFCPILLINNMGKESDIDTKKIEDNLKIKVLVLNFESAKDIKKLKQLLPKLQNENNQNKNIFLNLYDKNTLEKLNLISNKFNKNIYEIVKIIEKNAFFLKKNQKNGVFLENIDKNFGNNFLLPANSRHEFIEQICKKPISKKFYGEEFLDKFFLNKFFAIPIFFVIMLSIFYLTFFSVGSFFSDIFLFVIDSYISPFIDSLMHSICSVEWINALIVFGIIGGVGSLFAFLPQVVLLFLFLALLEETGYFARIAFIFEDFFASIGLSGKSVYTLLMGFGCSASAVLTARTLDNKNAKIKTAILTPYMSCSAKLPIYAILGGAFFGAGNIYIIFLLYLLGVFTALFVSLILDKIGLKNKSLPFILEFPPYHLPKIKKVLKIVWINFKSFFIKITTIFISMSAIMWCLSSFDTHFAYVQTSGGKSILQVISEFIAPLFTPLGFNNWGAVGALVGGIIAKEIIVSSIAIFNGISSQNADMHFEIKKSLTDSNSAVNFTANSSLSFLTFCLLYCPCIATIAILRKEIGLKWTVISIIIQLIIAYIMAFVVFNLFKLINIFGVLGIIFLILTTYFIIFSFFHIFSFLKHSKSCKNCGLCKK